jgi:hypothetical protein
MLASHRPLQGGAFGDVCHQVVQEEIFAEFLRLEQLVQLNELPAPVE